MKPELSVIISWCDRPELTRTLAENRLLLERYDAEVIVVNCAGSQANLRQILSAPRPHRLRCVDLQATLFNKSLALNMGASIAQSDRLFLLDTDIILNEDFLPIAFDVVAGQRFFTVERVFESVPEPVPPDDQLEEMTNKISFVSKDGRTATVAVRRNLLNSSRNAPGLVLLARKHFLEVGGMN